jgi:hypothetical protein
MNDSDENAIVGFKKCGCAVAADLDCKPESAAEYLKRGYQIRTMTKSEAISMLKAAECFHGVMRCPL